MYSVILGDFNRVKKWMVFTERLLDLSSIFSSLGSVCHVYNLIG